MNWQGGVSDPWAGPHLAPLASQVRTASSAWVWLLLQAICIPEFGFCHKLSAFLPRTGICCACN